MEHGSGKFRTAMLMIAASFVVVAAICVFAITGSKHTQREGIVLPPPDWRPGDSQNAQDESSFVSVSPENVADVIRQMQRPAFYHQVLTLTHRFDGTASQQTVHIWTSRQIQRIVTEQDGRSRNILTDGQTAYLWYRDEPGNVKSVSLPENVSADDLAGIATYETVCDLPTEDILSAEYLYSPEVGEFPCLHVAAETDGITDEFRIDLETGLLRSSAVIEDQELFLEMEQTELQILDESDEALLSQMLLPNGTDPFATASEKMQPE